MFTLGDVADILDDALDMGINIVDALHKLAEAGDRGKITKDDCLNQLEISGSESMPTSRQRSETFETDSSYKLDGNISNKCVSSTSSTLGNSRKVSGKRQSGNFAAVDSTSGGQGFHHSLQNTTFDSLQESEVSPMKISSHNIEKTSAILKLAAADEGKFDEIYESTNDNDFYDKPLESYESKRWSTSFALNVENGDFCPVSTNELIESPVKTESLCSYASSCHDPGSPGEFPSPKRKRRNTYSIESTPVSEAEGKGLPIIDALDDLCQMAEQFINVNWNDDTDNEQDFASENRFGNDKNYDTYSSEDEISPTASCVIDEKIFALDKETARAFQNFQLASDGGTKLLDKHSHGNMSSNGGLVSRVNLDQMVDKGIEYIGNQAKVVLESFEALKHLKQCGNANFATFHGEHTGEHTDSDICYGGYKEISRNTDVPVDVTLGFENMQEIQGKLVLPSDEQFVIAKTDNHGTLNGNENEKFLEGSMDLNDDMKLKESVSKESLPEDIRVVDGFKEVYTSIEESLPCDFQTVQDVTYDYSEEIDTAVNNTIPKHYVSQTVHVKRPGTYVLEVAGAEDLSSESVSTFNKSAIAVASTQKPLNQNNASMKTGELRHQAEDCLKNGKEHVITTTLFMQNKKANEKEYGIVESFGNSNALDNHLKLKTAATYRHNEVSTRRKQRPGTYVLEKRKEFLPTGGENEIVGVVLDGKLGGKESLESHPKLLIEDTEKKQPITDPLGKAKLDSANEAGVNETCLSFEIEGKQLEVNEEDAEYDKCASKKKKRPGTYVLNKKSDALTQEHNVLLAEDSNVKGNIKMDYKSISATDVKENFVEKGTEKNSEELVTDRQTIVGVPEVGSRILQTEEKTALLGNEEKQVNCQAKRPRTYILSTKIDALVQEPSAFPTEDHVIDSIDGRNIENDSSSVFETGLKTILFEKESERVIEEAAIDSPTVDDLEEIGSRVPQKEETVIKGKEQKPIKDRRKRPGTYVLEKCKLVPIESHEKFRDDKAAEEKFNEKTKEDDGIVKEDSSPRRIRRRPGTYVLDRALQDSTTIIASSDSENQSAWGLSGNLGKETAKIVENRAVRIRPATFVLANEPPLPLVGTDEIFVHSENRKEEEKEREGRLSEQTNFTDVLSSAPVTGTRVDGSQMAGEPLGPVNDALSKDMEQQITSRQPRPRTYVIESNKTNILKKATIDETCSYSDANRDETVSGNVVSDPGVKKERTSCVEDIDSSSGGEAAVRDVGSCVEQFYLPFKTISNTVVSQTNVGHDQGSLDGREDKERDSPAIASNDCKKPQNLRRSEAKEIGEVSETTERPISIKWRVSKRILEPMKTSIKLTSGIPKDEKQNVYFESGLKLIDDGSKIINDVKYDSDRIVTGPSISTEKLGSKVTAELNSRDMTPGHSQYYDESILGAPSVKEIVENSETNEEANHKEVPRQEDYSLDEQKNEDFYQESENLSSIGVSWSENKTVSLEEESQLVVSSRKKALDVCEPEASKNNYPEDTSSIVKDDVIEINDMKENTLFKIEKANFDDQRKGDAVKTDFFQDPIDDNKDSYISLSEKASVEKQELNNNEVKTVERDFSPKTDYIEMADERAVLSTYAENDCCQDQNIHNGTAGFNFSKEPVEGRVEGLNKNKRREVLGRGEPHEGDYNVSKTVDDESLRKTLLQLDDVAADRKSSNPVGSLSNHAEISNDHRDPLANVIATDVGKVKTGISSNTVLNSEESLEEEVRTIIDRGHLDSESVVTDADMATNRIAVKLEINFSDLNDNADTGNAGHERSPTPNSHEKVYGGQYGNEFTEASYRSNKNTELPPHDPSTCFVENDGKKIQLKLEIENPKCPDRSRDNSSQGVRFDVNFEKDSKKTASPPEDLKRRLSVKTRKKIKERPGTYVLNSPIFSRDEYEDEEAFERSLARRSLGSSEESGLQDEIRKAIEQGRLELEQDAVDSPSDDADKSYDGLGTTFDLKDKRVDKLADPSTAFDLQHITKSDGRVEVKSGSSGSQRPPRPGTYVLKVSEETGTQEKEQLIESCSLISSKDRMNTHHLSPRTEEEESKNSEKRLSEKKTAKKSVKDSKRESLEKFKKSFDKQRIGFFVDISQNEIDDSNAEDAVENDIVRSERNERRETEDSDNDLTATDYQLQGHDIEENISKWCSEHGSTFVNEKPLANTAAMEVSNEYLSDGNADCSLQENEINPKVNIWINKSTEDKDDSISTVNNSSNVLEDKTFFQKSALQGADNGRSEETMGHFENESTSSAMRGSAISVGSENKKSVERDKANVSMQNQDDCTLTMSTSDSEIASDETMQGDNNESPRKFERNNVFQRPRYCDSDDEKQIGYSSWRITPDKEKEVLHRISSLSEQEFRNINRKTAKDQIEDGIVINYARQFVRDDIQISASESVVNKKQEEDVNERQSLSHVDEATAVNEFSQSGETKTSPRQKSEYFIIEYDALCKENTEEHDCRRNEKKASGVRKSECFVIGEEFDSPKMRRKKSDGEKGTRQDLINEQPNKGSGSVVKRKNTFVIKYANSSEKSEMENIGIPVVSKEDRTEVVDTTSADGLPAKPIMREPELKDDVKEGPTLINCFEKVNTVSSLCEKGLDQDERPYQHETIVEDFDLYVSNGSRPASGISESQSVSTEAEDDQRILRNDDVAHSSDEESSVQGNKDATGSSVCGVLHDGTQKFVAKDDVVESFTKRGSLDDPASSHEIISTVRERSLTDSSTLIVRKSFDRQVSDSAVSIFNSSYTNSNTAGRPESLTDESRGKTMGRQLSENIQHRSDDLQEMQANLAGGKASLSMPSLDSDLSRNPFKVPRTKRTQNLGHRPMSYDIARKPLLERLEKLCTFMTKSLTKLNTMSEDESEIVVKVDKKRGREDMFLRRRMARDMSKNHQVDDWGRDENGKNEVDEKTYLRNELNEAAKDKNGDLSNDQGVQEDITEAGDVKLREGVRKARRGNTYVIQKEDSLSSVDSGNDDVGHVDNLREDRLSEAVDNDGKLAAVASMETRSRARRKDEGASNAPRDSLAPRLAILKMQLEEKRRHIEEEKRKMMDQWNEERTKLGQQAFWLAVGKESKEERERREQKKQAALDAEKNKKPGLLFFPFSDENDPAKIGKNPRRKRSSNESPPNECSTPVTPVPSQARAHRVQSSTSDYTVHQNRVGSATIMEASQFEDQGETFLVARYDNDELQRPVFDNQEAEVNEYHKDRVLDNSSPREEYNEKYNENVRQNRISARQDLVDHTPMERETLAIRPTYTESRINDQQEQYPDSYSDIHRNVREHKEERHQTKDGLRRNEEGYYSENPVQQHLHEAAGQQRYYETTQQQHYHETTEQQHYVLNQDTKHITRTRSAWADPYMIPTSDLPASSISEVHPVPDTLEDNAGTTAYNTLDHDNNYAIGGVIKTVKVEGPSDGPTGFHGSPRPMTEFVQPDSTDVLSSGPKHEPSQQHLTNYTESTQEEGVAADDLSLTPGGGHKMHVNVAETIESGPTTLTPEQQKKKEKFIQNRIKRQQEEKAKREMEQEKKRRKEEKLKERKVLLEKKEREEQEKMRRQRQEEDEIRRRMEEEDEGRKMTQRLPRREDQWNTPPNRRQVNSHHSENEDFSQQPSSFAEYKGPPVYVKPTAKSNRQIMINAISYCCLSGEVNREAKEKSLQVLSQSNAAHFFVLFRDGLKFRGLYTYSQEADEALKISGVGPKVITNKMIERLFKYSSGAKSFSQIPSAKSLSIQADGMQIKKECWTPAKGSHLSSKTDSNLRKGSPANSKSDKLKKGSPKTSRR